MQKLTGTKNNSNLCFFIHRPLTHEQRSVQDGLIHLVIKDKDMFSVSNTFVGEAYLHFSEVPDTPAPISSLPQQHLPLSRPANIGKIFYFSDI